MQNNALESTLLSLLAQPLRMDEIRKPESRS